MRTVASSLEQARALVVPALKEAVETLHPGNRSVCGYHLGWLDELGKETVSDSGKAVRPALALLSADAAGAPPETALPAAVAVELVHNFSLIHDDVMDEDRERRHRPTAWTVFGEARAILAGDALFALAAQVLLRSGSAHRTHALGLLLDATSELIWGQAEDLDFESRLDVSPGEVVAMSAAKTGALMSCSSAIGAVLAGAPARTTGALASFGRHLGIAFQAVDDLLGIWGRPQTTGKPAFNDLIQKKKSLAVVQGLSGSGPHTLQLRKILSADEVTAEDARRAARLLEESGARSWAERVAHEELGHALEALHSAPMEEDARLQLEEMARFVTERDF